MDSMVMHTFMLVGILMIVGAFFLRKRAVQAAHEEAERLELAEAKARVEERRFKKALVIGYGKEDRTEIDFDPEMMAKSPWHGHVESCAFAYEIAKEKRPGVVLDRLDLLK